MSKDFTKHLSKIYIDKFYQLVLECGLTKKDIKTIRKNVEKYEDFDYIDTIFNAEVKNKLVEKFNLSQENNEEECTILMHQIDDFYAENFESTNEFSVGKIKRNAKSIQNGLSKLLSGFDIVELNLIDSFYVNISKEMDAYKKKTKANEFLEIDVVKETIKTYCEQTKSLLKLVVLQESKHYFEDYLSILKHSFKYIFENAKTRRMPDWLKGLIFVAPWIVGFIAFTFYPLLQTLIFSFSKVNLTPDGFTTSWIGFENYKNITQDTDFILAIKNYFANMIVYVPLITVFSLILALLLNSKVKGIGVFRTIFFFPVIITSGPVIKILIEQGVTSMPGLSTLIDLDGIRAGLPPFIAMMFDILTNEFIMILWYSGIQILVFITGLQKIDKGVYEASSIDGANKWEQFWKVTLPAINPVIVINVVFTVVMQSIFALNPIILKIQSDMNDSASGKGYQYSSAIAFTYFLIIILTLAVFVLIFKKHNKKVRKGGK